MFAAALLLLLQAPNEDDGAILSGLHWLLRHQSANGAWQNTDPARSCDCVKPAAAPSAFFTTGLALNAFLGAGYTHLSKDRCCAITTGTTVKNGLQFLIKNLDEQEGFCRPDDPQAILTHAMATLALTEAYGLTSSSMLKDAAQKSLDLLVGMRHSDGGWGRAQGSADSDPFTTVIAAMVFKSGLDAELAFNGDDIRDKLKAWCTQRLLGCDPSEALLVSSLMFIPHLMNIPLDSARNQQQVMQWLARTGKDTLGEEQRNELAHRLKALESDDPHERQEAVVELRRLRSGATATLARYWLDHPDPEVRSRIEEALDTSARTGLHGLAVFLVDQHPPDWNKPDAIAWVIGSYALFRIDGPSGRLWKGWNARLRPVIDKHLDRRRDHCAYGCWQIDDAVQKNWGPIAANAIHAWLCEVYVRYPAVFTEKGR